MDEMKKNGPAFRLLNSLIMTVSCCVLLHKKLTKSYYHLLVYFPPLVPAVCVHLNEMHNLKQESNFPLSSTALSVLVLHQHRDPQDEM